MNLMYTKIYTISATWIFHNGKYSKYNITTTTERDHRWSPNLHVCQHLYIDWLTPKRYKPNKYSG